MSILKNIQPWTARELYITGANFYNECSFKQCTNNDHAPQGDHEGCDDCNDNEGEQRGKLN